MDILLVDFLVDAILATAYEFDGEPLFDKLALLFKMEPWKKEVIEILPWTPVPRYLPKRLRFEEGTSSKSKPVQNSISIANWFCQESIRIEFSKTVENFKHCFNGVVKNEKLSGTADYTNVELVEAQLNVKKSGQNVVISGDDWKKGEDPINVFLGIYTEKCGNNDHNNFDFSCDSVEKVKRSMSKKGLEDRYGNNNGANLCGDFLRFEVEFPFFINGLLKDEKNGVEKLSNEDNSCYDDSKVRVRVKQRKDLSFEYLKRFIFDKLSNFPMSDLSAQAYDCKNDGKEALTRPVNQLDHFKALLSVLGGKREFVHGFLRNLKFARVGGVPSSIGGVPLVKDVDEGVVSAVHEEDGEGNSSQKLANGLLSVPLSNADCLRSTLSTVSLTELIDLLPQIGRPSKEDHPDKTKIVLGSGFLQIH
ncbi:hypothetical protein DH2020_021628 [Rehmannia glutinosa]|uniref:Uncharacterized protein n=1 Tax=Rehmannia glutinosa TaxID=99300 RepID=A0ABR0WBH5_REHGL